MSNETTASPIHFWDIPLELRLLIYLESLPLAFHIDQQLPPVTYEGKDLTESPTTTDLTNYDLLFNSALRPLLNLTPQEVLQAEFKKLIKQPAGHQHVFKTTCENINNLATWTPPHPISEYHNVVISIDNDLLTTSKSKNVITKFLSLFQNINHIHIYISNRTRHQGSGQMLIYTLKDILKRLPEIKTMIICYGQEGIGASPDKQYVWKKGNDGAMRHFDPRFRGVYGVGTMGVAPVLVKLPVPNFIPAGSNWDGVTTRKVHFSPT